MVADRLGVRRTDADVDERDAAAIGGDEVIRRHLVSPPRAVGDERARIDAGLVDVKAGGAGERGVAPLPDLRTRPGEDFIDIALDVGAVDIELNMLGRGSGLVWEEGAASIGAVGTAPAERP